MFLILSFLIFSSTSQAWETDQITQRTTPIKESFGILNEKVNTEINAAVKEWSPQDDRFSIAHTIYKKLSGSHLLSQYESWIKNNPEINKLWLETNLYSKANITASRMNWFFNVSPTILINGYRVGTDKPAHFFSEGYSYFKIAKQNQFRFEKAIEYGIKTENTFFGKLVSGQFSNADLVANYEGMLFYLSLFFDDIIPGKAAILKITENQIEIQRPFDFSDHINAFWDEALLPSQPVKALKKIIISYLKNQCDEYFKNPELFISLEEEKLRNRYLKLKLEYADDLRFDRICR